jgi:hypothetical protein
VLLISTTKAVRLLQSGSYELPGHNYPDLSEFPSEFLAAGLTQSSQAEHCDLAGRASGEDTVGFSSGSAGGFDKSHRRRQLELTSGRCEPRPRRSNRRQESGAPRPSGRDTWNETVNGTHISILTSKTGNMHFEKWVQVVLGAVNP